MTCIFLTCHYFCIGNQLQSRLVLPQPDYWLGCFAVVAVHCSGNIRPYVTCVTCVVLFCRWTLQAKGHNCTMPQPQSQSQPLRSSQVCCCSYIHNTVCGLSLLGYLIAEGFVAADVCHLPLLSCAMLTQCICSHASVILLLDGRHRRISAAASAMSSFCMLFHRHMCKLSGPLLFMVQTCAWCHTA